MARILIIDDDYFFGESLQKLLQAQSHEVVFVNSLSGADESLRQSMPDLIIVDVFLPDGSGYEWFVSRMEDPHFTFPVVFVSGVFNDALFRNKVLKTSTRVVDYFIKPIEDEAVWRNICNKIQDGAQKLNARAPEENLPQINQLMFSQFTDKETVIQFLTKGDNISGFELMPVLLKLLAEKVSGKLMVKSQQGEYTISLFEGGISNVRATNSMYLLGELLEKLFNIKKILSPNKKNQAVPIGKYLVDQKLITDDQRNYTVEVQISLRLFSLFSSSVLELKLEQAEASQGTALYKTYHLERIIHRFFLESKTDYLYQFYNGHSQRRFVQKGSLNDRQKGLDLIHRNPHIIAECLKHRTVGAFLKDAKGDAIKAFHLSLLFGCVELESGSDEQNNLKKYTNLYQKLERENYFDRLNVSKESSEDLVTSQYKDLVKCYHPDRLIHASDEVKNVCSAIMNLISEAYRVLAHPKKKDEYLNQLSLKRMVDKNVEHEARKTFIQLLIKGDLSKAKKRISEIQFTFHEKQVLILWMLNLSVKTQKSRKKVILKIKNYIHNLYAPNQGFEEIYYFVFGLSYETLGNYQKAIDCYKKAKNYQNLVPVLPQHLKEAELKHYRIQKKRRNWQMATSFVGTVLIVSGIVFIKDMTIIDKLETSQTTRLIAEAVPNLSDEFVFVEKQKGYTFFSSKASVGRVVVDENIEPNQSWEDRIRALGAMLDQSVSIDGEQIKFGGNKVVLKESSGVQFYFIGFEPDDALLQKLFDRW